MTEELKNNLTNGSSEYMCASENDELTPTIEFSIKRKDVEEVMGWIDNNIDLPKYSFWFAYECKTCKKYHGKEYVHLAIEKLGTGFIDFENGINIPKIIDEWIFDDEIWEKKE